MKTAKKRTYIIILIAFIISLIPMYIIGFYAHPSADDYYYGADTAPVWQENGSLTAVIGTAFDEMLDTYNEWQGNYAAIFLMRLQPGIFGEQFYALAPIVLITAYVLASVLFYNVFLQKIFGAEKYLSRIIAISITFVSMQLVKVPSDSFYWYNGAIYYTFFYSIALVLLALVILLLFAGNCSIAFSIAVAVIGIILSFILGGGNYLTALSLSVIMVLVTGYTCTTFMTEKRKGQKEHFSLKKVIPIVLISISLLSGFMLNISAPGNGLRQSQTGATTSLIKTFIYTFAYGAYAVADTLNAPAIIFFICISPLLYKLARSAAEKFGYTYPMPIIAVILTFGIFCSQGTPVFFAQGLRMPYRASNIICFSSYILILFNLLYLYGYMGRKHQGSRLISEAEKTFTSLAAKPKRAMICLFAVLAAFCVGCVGMIEVSEAEYKSGKAAFTCMPTSVAATFSLLNGSAKTYDDELNARAEYLANCTENYAVVPALSCTPDPIFHNDITDDPLDWKNAHMALFYAPEYICTE